MIPRLELLLVDKSILLARALLALAADNDRHPAAGHTVPFEGIHSHISRHDGLGKPLGGRRTVVVSVARVKDATALDLVPRDHVAADHNLVLFGMPVHIPGPIHHETRD